MLSVKVLMAGHGWQTGTVLATGAVAIDTGEVVPAHRIQAIVHHPREQVPHEGPNPQELGWLVLLCVIFFEGKRAELEAAAWPDWKVRNGVLRAAATLSELVALAVTATQSGCSRCDVSVG